MTSVLTVKCERKKTRNKDMRLQVVPLVERVELAQLAALEEKMVDHW